MRISIGKTLKMTTIALALTVTISGISIAAMGIGLDKKPVGVSYSLKDNDLRSLKPTDPKFDYSKQNTEVLNYINALNPKKYSAVKRGFITEREAREIHETISRHEVAGLGALSKYDPKGSIGFCFGRAVAVNLEALHRKLDPTKVLKLWVMGKGNSMKAKKNPDLQLWDFHKGSQEVKWEFHVVTIIKGQGNQWWAIDPVFKKPLLAQNWVKSMVDMTDNKDLFLVATNADRFSLDRESLEFAFALDDRKFYNNYFKDLFTSYYKNSPL